MNSQGEPRSHAERAAMGPLAHDGAFPGGLAVVGAESASDRRTGVQSEGEMIVVLSWAAGHDGRERGPLEAKVWLEQFRGFDMQELRQAITEHYRRSRWPVMPSDVHEIIEEGV